MMRSFEGRKTAYQAFVEERVGGLREHSAGGGIFRKKKSRVPGFCGKSLR